MKKSTALLALCRAFAALSALPTLTFASAAHAEPATIVIQTPPEYAPPPRQAIVDSPIAAPSPDPPRTDDHGYDDTFLAARYRSPVRFSLGPLGATTGRGLGLGGGVGIDFGRDAIGFRMAAAWLRGESGGDGATLSPIASSLSQYTGELTLDFHKNGPVHPIFGLGFGLAHVDNGITSGNVGIGVARLGLEYAVPFDDEADVRIGAGVTGVLPGPSDSEVVNLRGYALFGAQIGMGF